MLQQWEQVESCSSVTGPSLPPICGVWYCRGSSVLLTVAPTFSAGFYCRTVSDPRALERAADGKIHPNICICSLTPPGTFIYKVQPQDGGSGLWRPARFPHRKFFCCISPVELSEVTQLLGNSPITRHAAAW